MQKCSRNCFQNRSPLTPTKMRTRTLLNLGNFVYETKFPKHDVSETFANVYTQICSYWTFLFRKHPWYIKKNFPKHCVLGTLFFWNFSQYIINKHRPYEKSCPLTLSASLTQIYNNCVRDQYWLWTVFCAGPVLAVYRPHNGPVQAQHLAHTRGVCRNLG